MAQGRGGDALEMGHPRHGIALQGGQGAGGADQGQLTPQTIGAQGQAQAGGLFQGLVGHGDSRQGRLGLLDLLTYLAVLALPLGDEGRLVALEFIPQTHYLDPGRQILGCSDLHREAEAVEELGP